MARKRRSSFGSGKKKGGFGGAIASLVTVVVLIAAIFGWARVNEIDSPTAALDYFREWSDYINDCGGGEAEWNCDTVLPGPGGPGGDSGSGDGSGGSGENNPEQVIGKLANVTIANEQEIDYDRSEWRHWSGSPCNAREQTLIDQGQDVETDDDCKITSGEWLDPFTGDVFTNSSDLDIDHIIPLSYAARHGGNDWSADRKEQFANDPMHLVAVSASANRSKGDSGPSDYMPDLRTYHCQYSTIWVNTAAEYDLSITQDDHKALEKGLATC